MNLSKLKGYSFAIFYLIYFAGMGGFMPFINQYLQTNLGLTGSQLGIFTFTTLIIAVFIVPIWGVIGDKTGKYKLLLLISLGLSIAAAFFYSIQTGYIAVIASGIILEVVRSGIISLSDVQAMNYTSTHHGNYGFIRSMGSLGYVIGSLLVGAVVSENDYSPVFTVYISILLLSLVIAFTFPKTDIKQETSKNKNSGSVKDVLKNKHFLFIVLASLLTTILMDSANGYAGIHMVNTLGGNASSAGKFTFATALPEIILLGIIGKWFSKYGYKKIYLLNAAVLVVRYIIYAIAPNNFVFLIASLVHCIGTGIATVGNLGYLKVVIGKENYGTAVTLMNAGFAVGRAIYSLIFGYMLDWFGSSSIFIFSAVGMFIALIMIMKTSMFKIIDENA